MTQNQFVALCVARSIDPAIALENPQIVAALRDKNATLVIHLLDTEF